jgi:hypothetical protein
LQIPSAVLVQLGAAGIYWITANTSTNITPATDRHFSTLQ